MKTAAMQSDKATRVYAAKERRIEMAEKQKSSKGLIIIIAVLVVLLVAALGITVGFLYQYKLKAASAVNTNTQLTNNSVMEVKVSTLTFALDEFLVNLSDEGGRRYIKAKVFVGYDNKKLSKELESVKPQIRDAVNSLLRAKKTTDFTEKGTEDIKKEILNRINPMLKSAKADNIYFYDILIQ